ncbi:hypothetical protein MP975_23950, partial [Escherichia coli]|uniref:hypothetical protein n=1 Tax=Escherichia coli TaxID=562 RepID=UPI001F60A52C|nr:hypothetical protein [Escherichia coli]MCI3423402.1 hypothetical protein [Escherichia coli]
PFRLPGVTFFCISDTLVPTTYLVDTTLSNSSDSDQTVQAVRLRKTQQMHQSKNMIGETRCICVMFPDIQVAFVVQQSIKHMC